jgi:hypothetical protein
MFKNNCCRYTAVQLITFLTMVSNRTAVKEGGKVIQVNYKAINR